MMKSLVRMRKVGGSLVVTVPSEIVEEKSLREGELVEFSLEKARRSFFGSAKGIGSFTEEDKFKGQLEEDE